MRLARSYNSKVLKYILAVLAFLFFCSGVASQGDNTRDSVKAKKRPYGNRCEYFYKGELAKELKRRQQKSNAQTPALPDADGDGITDQFDLEPNTPPGVQVDAHGHAVDTDGDGVPDYKDKEKLTQKNCFPVNADGVGACPEPPIICYSDSFILAHKRKVVDCYINRLPSIAFKVGSGKLSNNAIALLDSVAQLLLANPHCHAKVRCNYEEDYRGQQLAWDRVFTIIKYLVDTKGVLSTHLIFNYESEGDFNTVILEPTINDGPNMVPAPHPMFSTLKNRSYDE